MNDTYEICWVGWNNSFDGKTQHDKIWGWLCIKDGRLYNFWGRRGKTLRFKKQLSEYNLYRLRDQKIKKGYTLVDPTDYNNLVKDFLEEVELYCMSAILSDTIM